MLYSTSRSAPLPLLFRIVGDLRGLFFVQGLLLALTCLTTPSDVGDLRVQLAWLAFLFPGWCLSAWWTGNRASLPIRYAHAVISAVGIHGCLSAAGSLFHLGFQGYFAAFFAVAMVLLLLLGRPLQRRHRFQRLQMPVLEWMVWIAIMTLVISIYREPRSADIIQFSLQQQDMAASQSLQPSSIGMDALGVHEAMPRWRSHLWHLAPSLIAEVTSLPVVGVLRRWAPIPVAFSVFVVLVSVVRCLAGRRVPLWAVALAVFAPVLLWYRSYNAFNYSFRLTNNFCLDKDLCLFLVIPATIYLVVRWIGGRQRNLVPLAMLIPAIVKFHPMTPVYLLLLIPFVVVGYDRRSSSIAATDVDRLLIRRLLAKLIPSQRAIAWILLCGLLFVAVVWIGDAQTAHEQIDGIVRMDWRDHQSGRPLHYWVGQYATIIDHHLPLDTTEWSGGRLSLRARVLLNCGLLGVMHLAWVLWLLGSVLLGVWGSGSTVVWRRWCAITVVLAMLWGMWLVSSSFLTWRPHYLAGFERLHWFAYVPALVSVSGAVAIVMDAVSKWGNRTIGSVDAVSKVAIQRGTHWIGAVLVIVLLLYSAVCFRLQRESLWAHVRFLNSLLDFELPAQISREQSYDPRIVDWDLNAMRPGYLRENDRVLFLDNSGNDQFWLIKQGIYWSEPYAEAYAWRYRGDAFLEDRQFFYALLDRRSVEDVSSWLDRKQVSLLVDRRPDADAYLAELNERARLGMQRLRQGVWRRDRSSR